ncbi:MAG: hypothetical protein KBS47_07065 [Bacteroidales bacterium]|nr:hypothetical protein [Candidatus Equimonas enterica]
MSNKNHKAKKALREAKQERQARRTVNGIFIGLIVVGIVLVTILYLSM